MVNMEKKVILFLLVLFIVPLVSARQLEIEDIRFYLNDDRISDVSYSGTIDAEKNDDILIKVDLYNNGNTTVKEILFFAEIKDIDDGDDVEEELNEFDLDDGDDIRKELTLDIPKDADIDDYRLYVKIRGIVRINGTDHDELSVYNYTLDIGEKPIDQGKVLLDINNSLTTIQSMVRESYANASMISDLNQQIGEKKEQIRVKDGEITSKDNIISDKDTEINNKNNEITELNNDINKLEVNVPELEKNKMQIDLLQEEYSCTTKKCMDDKIKDIRDSYKLGFWVILGGGGAAFWYFRKKLLPQTSIAGQKPMLEGKNPINIFRR